MAEGLAQKGEGFLKSNAKWLSIAIHIIIALWVWNEGKVLGVEIADWIIYVGLGISAWIFYLLYKETQKLYDDLDKAQGALEVKPAKPKPGKKFEFGGTFPDNPFKEE